MYLCTVSPSFAMSNLLILPVAFLTDSVFSPSKRQMFTSPCQGHIFGLRPSARTKSRSSEVVVIDPSTQPPNSHSNKQCRPLLSPLPPESSFLPGSDRPGVRQKNPTVSLDLFPPVVGTPRRQRGGGEGAIPRVPRPRGELAGYGGSDADSCSLETIQSGRWKSLRLTTTDSLDTKSIRRFTAAELRARNSLLLPSEDGFGDFPRQKERDIPIVVEDQWMPTVPIAVVNEVQVLSQRKNSVIVTPRKLR